MNQEKDKQKSFSSSRVAFPWTSMNGNLCIWSVIQVMTKPCLHDSLSLRHKKSSVYSASFLDFCFDKREWRSGVCSSSLAKYVTLSVLAPNSKRRIQRLFYCCQGKKKRELWSSLSSSTTEQSPQEQAFPLYDLLLLDSRKNRKENDRRSLSVQCLL